MINQHKNKNHFQKYQNFKSLKIKIIFQNGQVKIIEDVIDFELTNIKTYLDGKGVQIGGIRYLTKNNYLPQSINKWVDHLIISKVETPTKISYIEKIFVNEKIAYNNEKIMIKNFRDLKKDVQNKKLVK